MSLTWEFIALLVFFLYLSVRWDHVRRPWAYLIGVGGLLLVLLGMFFGVAGTHRDVAIVMRIFGVLGLIVALLGAVLACFGGRLDRFGLDKGQTAAGGNTPPFQQ